MKRLIIFFTIIFLSLSSFAQMKKVENTAPLIKRMEQSAASVKSIASDFKQTKHIEAFNQTIVSSGEFYYKVSDKIRLNYIKPQNYFIAINNNKMKIESGSKKNVMNLKDNKQLQEIHNMLTACMTGNFSRISGNYRTEFFEDAQFYLISVIPVNEEIKKNVVQFDIYLNKKDMSVDRLRISETETDYTEYHFSNKKLNTLNNNSLFEI